VVSLFLVEVEMKLSAAIRKGIEMDGPQVFGQYATWDAEGKMNGCCALGAAAIAIKGTSLPFGSSSSFNDILMENGLTRPLVPTEKIPEEALPYFYNLNVARDPLLKSIHVAELVVILNDNLKWTRERIADWLEGIGH